MRSDEPSATARSVATGVLLLALDPDLGHLAPRHAGEMSRLLLAACPGASRDRVDRLRAPWRRALLWRLERLLFPGVVLHYTLRKRLLEDAVREAVQEGFEQVVVLGAGLDTLAARLHAELPSVSFIEIDHPATQRVKRAGLEAAVRPGDNLHLLPVDLTGRTLAQALEACPAYRRDRATFFVAEGVLMYLAEHDVHTLLETIREHGGPRSRLAFSFIERGPDGSPRAGGQGGLVTAWLRRRGEPYQWGLPAADAADFLRAHGFALRELWTPAGTRERYFPLATRPDIPLGAEHLCVAEHRAHA